QDVRFAARMLRKSLGFTLVVLAALALGVGATTIIFTVVKSVLLDRLPFPDPDRLISIREIRPDGVLNPSVQTQNFLDWRARNHSFEAMAAVQQIPANVVLAGNAEQVNSLLVSSDFFPLFGVRPLLGRWITSADDSRGAALRVVLSFGYWQARFGGDPNIIGRPINIFGSPGEVIGVMPADFALPDLRVELFAPAQINPASAPRDGRHFHIYARLRPGVSTAAADAEIHRLAAQTTSERPEMNARWSATAIPLLADAVRDVRTALWVLLAAVFFLLILCCVNVANLYLMRTYQRARELVLRHALGAGRGRLIQQLVAESLLLALLGGALGILLAYAGLHTLLAMLPLNFPLPRLAQIHVDGTVLLACLAISLAAGLIFGLAPALAADFSNPANTLRKAGRAVTGSRNLLGNALVVAEVALALVLVCGAGLMARSFIELNRTNPGFRPEHVVTLRMLLVPAKYGRDPYTGAAAVERMLESIRELPRVIAASSIHLAPMGGVGSASGIARADRPTNAPGFGHGAGYSVISEGYFHTMGIPVLAGREFDQRDRRDAPPVAVINQSAARMLYPGEDPIGKELALDWSGPPRARIVGIVADSHFDGVASRPGPFVYLPNAQYPTLLCTLVVRTAGDPAGMLAAIRDAVRGVDPDQGILETSTMEQRMAGSVARPRLQTILLGSFGFLALVLACIGIYGVLAYAVSQRMREMGVRLAIGASPARILREVLGGGLRLTAIGLLLGLAASAGLTRYLEALLYQVRPTDPIVFASAMGAILLVALLACYLPARRAASVDPIVVLREE
ncbi:MAG TPA: ABC transporter permease, partial [Bryobacteraceae bacterium]|nr:ABC transporter permease [Bryobacteraceae bacterium]